MRFFSASVFFLLVPFLLCSCADSDADVISVTASVVFDYGTEKSAPVSRLAVFSAVSSDARRADSFTVTNKKSGYVWTVWNPSVFKGDSREYACAAALSAPYGETIPAGEYEIVYYDAAGEEDAMRFFVDYDEHIPESSADELKDVLKGSSEYVAVYDSEGELLYMGRPKASWIDNSAILREYRIGDTKRICYVTPGNGVVCMLPPEKLRNEEE